MEVDVRLARGGVPVLMHDRSAWRTARRPAPVRLRRPDRLVTLREALAALPDGLGVALDVKEPRAMAATLAELGTRPALVWCRDVPALRKAAATGAELALLRNTTTVASTRRYLRDAVAAGAHAVSLHERAVTPAAVAEGHDLGLVVYAWSLRPETHEPLIAAGIDGLVTDWPERARLLVPRDGGPRTAR